MYRLLPDLPAGDGEAERFLPSFIDKVEVMSKHGVSDEHIVTPRHRLPERLRPRDAGGSGAGGQSAGRYNLHIGGNRSGTRIPRMYRENNAESEILDSLDELVGRWAKGAKRVEASATLRCVRASFARCSIQPAISGVTSWCPVARSDPGL
jgi:sulfite reductase (NADPH) hemoprotein beta-component